MLCTNMKEDDTDPHAHTTQKSVNDAADQSRFFKYTIKQSHQNNDGTRTHTHTLKPGYLLTILVRL